MHPGKYPTFASVRRTFRIDRGRFSIAYSFHEFERIVFDFIPYSISYRCVEGVQNFNGPGTVRDGFLRNLKQTTAYEQTRFWGWGVFRLWPSLVNLTAFPCDVSSHCESLLPHGSAIVLPSVCLAHLTIAISSSARWGRFIVSMSPRTSNSHILSPGRRLAALSHATIDRGGSHHSTPEAGLGERVEHFEGATGQTAESPLSRPEQCLSHSISSHKSSRNIKKKLTQAKRRGIRVLDDSSIGTELSQRKIQKVSH
jgi:hypothetical protein